jgi:hypothetical protein
MFIVISKAGEARIFLEPAGAEAHLERNPDHKILEASVTYTEYVPTRKELAPKPVPAAQAQAGEIAELRALVLKLAQAQLSPAHAPTLNQPAAK